jgi:16S rRNA (cytosine1402-N4)-methyltransferase
MEPSNPAPSHVPVLLEEAMTALAVQPGGRYIDCTAGGGGHARAILERSAPGGQLMAIDADPAAIEASRKTLEAYRSSVLLVNDNFANLQAICLKYDFFPVHGILFDLGLSSLQLGADDRGFSFQHDAPLDMRFDTRLEVTAADIVNRSSEAELAHLIHNYGEEASSRRIARHIVKERPVKSTLHLARIITQALGKRRGRIHPATKTFQALRIAVNRELEALEAALSQSVDLLGCEGRLVVISYHSLEDRMVKRMLQREARGCICPPATPVCICEHRARLSLVHRRVITPAVDEIRRNPRSRSAKLRVAERIVPDDCDITTELTDFFAEAESRAWRRPALLRKLAMVFVDN